MTSDEIAAARDGEQEAVSDSTLEETSPIESELKPNEAPQADDAEDAK
jgi:hypothetical protein